MDSKIDYSNYKANSLLNDAYFLESEQHPTPESILFWDKLARENKQLGKEIAIARDFLQMLQHIPKPYLPQQKVDAFGNAYPNRIVRKYRTKEKDLSCTVLWLQLALLSF